MPRRNRVDPWGDHHATEARGMFTGNRGCLVDDNGDVVRHHRGSLWITCLTEYRDWQHPLAAPRTWTPLFFLDDAVALAAGHRPCGLCRRADYLAYRAAVTVGQGRTDLLAEGSSGSGRGGTADRPVLAAELNRRLAQERLRRGRGPDRAADRILSIGQLDELPVGAVIVDPDRGEPQLLTRDHVQPFGFGGWGSPSPRPVGVVVEILTPPTSIVALANGFEPMLHATATATATALDVGVDSGSPELLGHGGNVSPSPGKERFGR